jgi:hypothetical protein
MPATRGNTLIHSDQDRSFESPRRLWKKDSFCSANHNTVRAQTRENVFYRAMVPERSIWAIIEPCGISWQPGFTEADQMCAFRSGHLGQSDRFGGRCGKLSKYRTILNYSNMDKFLARIQTFSPTSLSPRSVVFSRWPVLAPFDGDPHRNQNKWRLLFQTVKHLTEKGRYSVRLSAKLENAECTRLQESRSFSFNGRYDERGTSRSGAEHANLGE